MIKKDEVEIDSLELIKIKVLEYFDNYYDKDKNNVNVELLSILLIKKFNIFLSHNKLYKLRKLIEEEKGLIK